jgi:hypothetical protein
MFPSPRLYVVHLIIKETSLWMSSHGGVIMTSGVKKMLSTKVMLVTNI